MKKIIFGAAAILVLGLTGLTGLTGWTGCTREFQRHINNFTYTNPVKIDGTYTVIQNGFELKHLNVSIGR